MTPKEQLDLYMAAYKEAAEVSVKEAAQQLDPMAIRQAIAAVYGNTLGDMSDPKALLRKWNIVSRGRNAGRVMQAYNDALLGKAPAPAQGGSYVANPRSRSEIYNPPVAPSTAKPSRPTFQAGRVQQAANQQMASIQAANRLMKDRSAQAKSRADLIGKLSNLDMMLKKPAPKRIVKQSPDTAARNAEWMASRQAQKARDARYSAFGLGPGRKTPDTQIAGK